MDAPCYEVLEHTADLRMAFYGADMADLLVCAARGLFREILGRELPPATTEAVAVSMTMPEPDLLLRAWLGDLLYLSETEQVLFTEWDVTVDESGSLRGGAAGVPLTALPAAPHLDVKAVTYHGLYVAEFAGGLRAEVIFDL